MSTLPTLGAVGAIGRTRKSSAIVPLTNLNQTVNPLRASTEDPLPSFHNSNTSESNSIIEGHFSHGPQSLTMSNRSGGSDTGTARTATTTRSSILSSESFKAFEENIVTFLVGIQQQSLMNTAKRVNEKNQPWSIAQQRTLSGKLRRVFSKTNIFYMLFYTFIMLTSSSLSVPYEDIKSYQWGDYGWWIMLVFGFMRTWLMEKVPYVGIVVIAKFSPKEGSFGSMDNSIFVMVIAFTNQLYWIISNLIPSMYSYIVPIISILVSLLYIVVLFRSLPFFNRWENSLWSGFTFAKLGFSISTLILTTLPINYLDDNIFGVSLAGASFGFAILLFVLGCVTMEIYTRLVYRSVKHLFSVYLGIDDVNNWKISKEGDPTLFVNNLASVIEEERRFRSVNIFIRFAMTKARNVQRNEQKHGDFNLAMLFVKGAASQKSFTDVNLLLTSSMLIANFVASEDSNAFIYANHLIKRALRQHPNILNRYFIQMRLKELEIISSSSNRHATSNLEMKMLLQKIDAKEQQLAYFHRQFWKELQNEVVSDSKIIGVNQQIEKITAELEVLFGNLMTNFSGDKTALRTYARFLENYLFQKELASDLYFEAQIIEDEESKRVRKREPVNQIKISSKHNKVVPIVPTSPEEPRSAVDLFDEEIDEESLNGSDMVTPTQKKEMLYRTSLLVPEEHKFVYGFFIVFLLFGLALITITLAVNISFSNEISSKVFLVKQACTMNSVSHLIASGIRSLQSTIKFNGINDTALLQSFSAHKDRLKTLQDKARTVQTLSKTVGVFTTDMVNDFTHDDVTLYLPIVTPGQIVYEIRNTSLSETTKLVISNIDSLLESTIFQYNKTYESYVFMFWWLNRLPLMRSYESFCVNFIDRNQVVAQELRVIYIIIAVCVNAIVLLMSLSYLLVLYFHLRKINNLVRLFKRIGKDEVGKIFHRLDKDTREEVNKSQTDYLSPKRSVLIISLLIIVFAFVSGALIITEFFLNLDDSYVAMLNVAEAGRVLMNSQVVNFGLDEIVFDSPLKPNENDANFVLNQNYLALTVKSWNNLIYGAEYNNRKSILSENIPVVQSHQCNSTDYNCYGLDQLLDMLASQADQLNNQAYHHTIGPRDIYIKFMQFYSASKIMAYKLYAFIDTYVDLHQHPSRYLSGVFSSIGFIACLFLFYLGNNMFNRYWAQIHQMRIMFNYVSWEFIDSNDQLRDYALHYQYNSTASSNNGKNRKLKGMNRILQMFQDSNNDKEDEQAFSQVKAVLDSTVEGSIICNVDGSIRFFNQAAQDMFGYRITEIIGTGLAVLFSKKKVVDTLNSVLERMKNATSNFGETFEKLKAKRKNGKAFPARVNLCVSVLGDPNDKKRTIIISCFIKDITSELKHSILMAQEKTKSEALLLNILPLPVANRLRAGETNIYENFKDVTCLFSDIVGFTSLSSHLEPHQVVEMLNIIVNQFDLLCETYSLEKIKTIGDAYFLAGGLHQKQSDHPEKVINFGMGQFTILYNYNVKHNTNLNIRVGVHTGSVTAGVLGSSKFAYDLWGDAVNTASRMESTGEPGRIQISRATYERVYDLFEFETREVDVKGKGKMETYLLKDKHHQNPNPQAARIDTSKFLSIDLEEAENKQLAINYLDVNDGGSEAYYSENEDDEALSEKNNGKLLDDQPNEE
ncbi:predicted protein [Naegleria gruberi]|uniref:Predicted protein n=1 Tax=Naegleria gruberi TaxID=5762 RepID=D2UZ88_NAEGR|nr:uncharacterized protein NAEGRDRAFT_61849 [Naegleria gruberi]EFC50110.1 predicted protein [Naegleria gruberi]|eukprot:XP_002682854.1 predicted protein [Naegleria gruberi strain NEG-M]